MIERTSSVYPTGYIEIAWSHGPSETKEETMARKIPETNGPHDDSGSEAIAAHARSGHLDMNDPVIRREANRAMRQETRSHLWGDSAHRKGVRRALFIALIVLAVWIAALFTPVLLGIT